MFNKAAVAAILFFACLSVLSAHPGRTDRNGGHNGPNGYHYHNSGSGGGSTPRTSTPAPVPQEVTTAIYEGNDFQEALNKFLTGCDTLERDLPYFQSLGLGEEKSIKKNSRYYVYATARSGNTLIRFNDLTKQKRVTLIFAKNNRAFNSAEYEIFQYPNAKSRESANRWVMEIK
jgi:hypothetical protein